MAPDQAESFSEKPPVLDHFHHRFAVIRAIRYRRSYGGNTASFISGHFHARGWDRSVELPREFRQKTSWPNFFCKGVGLRVFMRLPVGPSSPRPKHFMKKKRTGGLAGGGAPGSKKEGPARRKRGFFSGTGKASCGGAFRSRANFAIFWRLSFPPSGAGQKKPLCRQGAGKCRHGPHTSSIAKIIGSGWRFGASIISRRWRRLRRLDPLVALASGGPMGVKRFEGPLGPCKQRAVRIKNKKTFAYYEKRPPDKTRGGDIFGLPTGPGGGRDSKARGRAA